MPGITLLGLGPGNPGQLTREAWELLNGADEIYLRTRQHPTVESFPATLKIFSFDELYETGETFESVYAQIVERVLELGKRSQGVIYAVPGHPFVAEATGPEIMRRSKTLGLACRVVEGLSFLEPVYSALGLDPFPRVTLMDALELSDKHAPTFEPDMPALIAQIYSPVIASDVKLTLSTVYPDQHPVWLIHSAGTDRQIVEALPLYEIDRSPHTGLLTALYVPPLGAGTSLESFQEIIAHLRAPDGCPWDKEQTHLSLRTHLLQEAYEAVNALDNEDPDEMREEFGDLLLQIVLQAQIAGEYGEFTMADVIKGIHDKIIRRHPHVFGEVKVGGVDDVLHNWEKLKAAERKGKGNGEKGLLDGVSVALPALTQAQEYQSRAARVGFDWPEIGGVLDKIREEIEEVKGSNDQRELESELGDLFFVLVNLARWKNVDAESVLREANAKFKRRFGYVEQGARQQAGSLQDMTLAEMDALWNEAKKQGL
jgi:tetrapyrrole methylase family protein/MazG family protein